MHRVLAWVYVDCPRSVVQVEARSIDKLGIYAPGRKIVSVTFLCRPVFSLCRVVVSQVEFSTIAPRIECEVSTCPRSRWRQSEDIRYMSRAPLGISDPVASKSFPGEQTPLLVHSIVPKMSKEFTASESSSDEGNHTHRRHSSIVSPDGILAESKAIFGARHKGATFDNDSLEEFYAPITTYEGAHRYDPNFEWEPAEERKLVRKVRRPQ